MLAAVLTLFADSGLFPQAWACSHGSTWLGPGATEFSDSSLIFWYSFIPAPVEDAGLGLDALF